MSTNDQPYTYCNFKDVPTDNLTPAEQDVIRLFRNRNGLAGVARTEREITLTDGVATTWINSEDELLLEVFAKAIRWGEDSGHINFLRSHHKEVSDRDQARMDVSKFKTITLCGSTRFKKEYEALTQKLTLEGNVVISCGVFGHADGIQISDEQKEQLDKIHFQKIAMADEIYIVNVDGYIGSSTKREIEFAKSLNMPVHYLEKQ